MKYSHILKLSFRICFKIKLMLIRCQFQPIRNENCTDVAIEMRSTLIRTRYFHPIRDPSTIANQIAEAFVSKPVKLYVSDGINWWWVWNLGDSFVFDRFENVTKKDFMDIVINITPYYVKYIFDTWVVFLYDSFWELNNILWFFCNLEHWQLISLIYYSIRTLIRPIFLRPSGVSWIRPRLHCQMCQMCYLIFPSYNWTIWNCSHSTSHL